MQEIRDSIENHAFDAFVKQFKEDRARGID
jgi:queuine tRNA-ribosyltransferase